VSKALLVRENFWNLFSKKGHDLVRIDQAKGRKLFVKFSGKRCVPAMRFPNGHDQIERRRHR